MADMLELESLEQLIGAIQRYQEEIETECIILRNTANMCDIAMGSDAIARKHIARLEEALVEMEKVQVMAADIEEVLKKDRERALSVYEE